MTRTWCIVWVLSASLVMAMLDSVPDPPGVNPSTTQCKVVQLDDGSCSALSRRSDSPGTTYSIPLGFVTAETCEPYRPTDRIVHTGQVGDPSPPALQSGRKSSFQS
jgi:hypothetical protein